MLIMDVSHLRGADSPGVAAHYHRDPFHVTGIVLHQTAVRFGVSARQLADAGGDREKALATRALRVKAHCVLFREHATHQPLLVYAAPLDWRMNHANGLNASTVGLEIDGLYPGLKGGKTWGDKPADLWTPQIRDAARSAVRDIFYRATGHGMEIRYLYAHRQSSATRRADPGEAIWRDVGLWAADELGLEIQPSRTWGKGLPIPEQWGGGKGERY